METLLSQIYINYILNDPNVSLIEIWHNKLFIWKYKGRPTFLSTLGLEFQHPLYYKINEYKQLSKKYHPDLSNSKSSRVLSGAIQAGINDVRQALEIQDGRYDSRNYIQWYAEFDRILSCKIAATRNKITRQLQTRLYDHSCLVSDCFSGYSEHQTFTECLQETFESSLQGKSIKEYMQERGPTIRERLAQDDIRGLNQRGPDCPPIKIGKEWFTFTCSTPEGELTVYGRSSRSDQESYRQRYGDVFSVYVGGPIDISPYEKRVHWTGSANYKEPKRPKNYFKSYTQQLCDEQRKLYRQRIKTNDSKKS